MISYNQGNILNTKMQTVVNPVNCVGVMGKGLALSFKILFPKMFDLYKVYCQRAFIRPGTLWIYRYSRPWWILSFPTKFDWRDPSKFEYLEKGLQKFTATYAEQGITSIAFPILGSGCGNLREDKVLELMTTYLEPLPIPVEIWKFDPLDKDEILEKLKACYNEGEWWYNQVDQAQTISDILRVPGIGLKTLQNEIQKQLCTEIHQ